MESGGFGSEGSDEDFSKVLMGMMEQLTNRDILYEPMKELHDKFPAWMEENRGKVKEDDLKRYEEQQLLVREIVGRFERTGYSDQNAGDREYIVERMQKVGWSSLWGCDRN
jgi:peroxin-19